MQTIDYYIDQVKNGNIDGGIERTKAYRFEDDGVVLVEKYEEEFEELKQKIDICKSQGINIPAYYDYKESNDGHFILEELAKGTEFAHLINENPDAIKVVENIPYSHIEKYIRDAFLLKINGIGAEPRRRNIFYDKEIGFTVIDVASMEKRNVEDMNILDVDYFFNMYYNVIPHKYEGNDYEKYISSKTKLNLIKAFQNGHPLFKKYERWIFREQAKYTDFFSENGIDLTLSEKEIEEFKNYIEEYIETELDKNMGDVYNDYKVPGSRLIELLKSSVNFCSTKELFGDDNITLEDYVKSSVIKKLIEKQRKIFPDIFENRDKGYKILEMNIDKIPDEEMKNIKLGPFIEDLTEKYGNKQIPIDDIMKYYYDICLAFKKIIHIRFEKKDNYFFEDLLNSLLDMIPADELMNRMKSIEVENALKLMEQGVDVLGEYPDEMSQSNTRTMGFAVFKTLTLVSFVFSGLILLLGIIIITFMK